MPPLSPPPLLWSSFFSPHPHRQLTTGGFAVTWAHVSHVTVSFPLPFSVQLCLPLRSLLALNRALQPLLTEGLGTSRTAIPEIQVRGREEAPSWAPTLCQAVFMAWGHGLQTLKIPASRFCQISYWWAPGGCKKIDPNPSAAYLWMVRGLSEAWLTFRCPLSQQNCCSDPIRQTPGFWLTSSSSAQISDQPDNFRLITITLLFLVW